MVHSMTTIIFRPIVSFSFWNSCSPFELGLVMWGNGPATSLGGLGRAGGGERKVAEIRTPSPSRNVAGDNGDAT